MKRSSIWFSWLLLSASLAPAQFFGGGGGSTLSTDILSLDRSTGSLNASSLQYVTLAANSTTTLLDYSGGPGYLQQWFIGLSSSDFKVREWARLEVYVDGEESPSIAGPIVRLHAADYGAASFNSVLIGAQTNALDNLGYVWNIPIPFSSSIRVDLKNEQPVSTGTLWSNLHYQTGVSNTWPRSKKLRVLYTETTGVAANAVHTLLDHQGIKGRLLGIYMRVTPSSVTLNYNEGDLKIYLNGSVSPQYVATGLEDYFQNSNYYEGGKLVGPYYGTTAKDADGSIGAFRFHVPDKITFESGLKITWNAGDNTQAAWAGTATIISAVYYYAEQ